MKLLLFLPMAILTLLSIQCFSQADFGIRRKKLQPVHIDTTTENIFIYEVPKAVIYFRQRDIRNYIEHINAKDQKNQSPYKVFQDTLNFGIKKIKIKDIFFSYDEKERDSILKRETITSGSQQLNKEFYIIGAELILANKFMVKSKETGRIVTMLVVKRTSGLYGTRYLDFILPDKKIFYQIITTLGE